VSGDFAWDVWRQAIAQGAVAALAPGLAVLGVRALLARRAAVDELHAADAGLP